MGGREGHTLFSLLSDQQLGLPVAINQNSWYCSQKDLS